jgi:hypothetical protein
VPHGDLERDLLRALEKCEQMLSRLRTQPHPISESGEGDSERVGGEGAEGLLEDLSPGPGPHAPGRSDDREAQQRLG